MKTMCRRSALVVLSLVLTYGIARAVDVTTCEQTVPAGQLGVLTGDLDCSDSAVNAIILSTGAKLNLNGFTVTGKTGGAGVWCRGRCKVTGPGTLTGHSLGIFSDATRGTAAVDGVTITNGSGIGIFAAEGARVAVRNATIDGFARGVSGNRVAIVGSTIANNTRSGVSGFAVSLKSTHVVDNGSFGAGTFRNDRGRQGALRATDCVITGNGANCGSETFCTDVAGDNYHLTNTTCGTPASVCQ